MSWYGDGGMETDIHGDEWFRRIRARHLELGADCPCGNGGEKDEHPELPDVRSNDGQVH